MELAINDLWTHLKARKNGKRKPYLSLLCIRSIGRQALSALDYLHSKGITHRDLKPANILVTKWNTETDTLAIKLADFGLIGIISEENTHHNTICGTVGYVAPEVVKANQRLEELKKQQDEGMEIVAQSRQVSYHSSVDIWALGKILEELVKGIPEHIRLLRGNTALVNMEPADRLIRRMMQEDPKKRPTAAECLTDPWMLQNDSSVSLTAQKRDRSPSKSSSERPFKKVIQMTFCNSITTDKASTLGDDNERRLAREMPRFRYRYERPVFG
jgi:serine/threonine protein kinase